MFEVIKEQLNKEIDELNKQLEPQEKKYELVENKLLAINDFQHDVFRQKDTGLKIIFVGLVDILVLAVCVVVCPNFLLLELCLMLAAMVGFYKEYSDKRKKVKKQFHKCLAISEIALVDGNKVELLKKLDNKKLNYKVLNDKFLEEVNNVLYSQRDIIKSNIDSIKSEIRTSKYVLDDIQNYEEDDEFYNALFAFRDAKSFEECNDLLIKYKNAKEIAQNYFEESTSYSSFSYDYNSGYKEKPKQIIKKM